MEVYVITLITDWILQIFIIPSIHIKTGLNSITEAFDHKKFF